MDVPPSICAGVVVGVVAEDDGSEDPAVRERDREKLPLADRSPPPLLSVNKKHSTRENSLFL